MIGLVIGVIPTNLPGLAEIRGSEELESELDLWVRTDSIFANAVKQGLREARTFDEFVVWAAGYLAPSGEFSSLPHRVEADVGLAGAIREAARRAGPTATSDVVAQGRRHEVARIEPGAASRFGREVLATLRDRPYPAALKARIPAAEDLARSPKQLLRGLTEAMDRTPGSQEVGHDLGAALQAAITGLCPPTQSEISLYVATSDGKVGSSGGERLLVTWVNEGRGRKAFEAKDLAALNEMVASRIRADVERRVGERPPSHDCIPERWISTLPQNASWIHEGDDEELALEILFGVEGWMASETPTRQDVVRPLDEAELTRLLHSLSRLSAMDRDALMAHVGPLVERVAGAPDYAEVIVDALDGGLLKSLRRFLEKALQKKRPVVLVACNDWGGTPATDGGD
jgi:hypothetical protein